MLSRAPCEGRARFFYDVIPIIRAGESPNSITFAPENQNTLRMKYNINNV